MSLVYTTSVLILRNEFGFGSAVQTAIFVVGGCAFEFEPRLVQMGTHRTFVWVICRSTSPKVRESEAAKFDWSRRAVGMNNVVCWTLRVWYIHIIRPDLHEGEHQGREEKRRNYLSVTTTCPQKAAKGMKPPTWHGRIKLEKGIWLMQFSSQIYYCPP